MRYNPKKTQMKQKKIFTLLITFCLLSTAAFTAVTDKKKQENKNYNADTMFFLKRNPPYSELWAKVEKFDKERKPKSALEIVDQIREMAKKEKNAGQIIKTFIYKLDYRNELEDNGFEKELKFMEEEAQQASFPENAVYKSLIGEIYVSYLDEKYYDIRNRSEVLNSDNQDITTWNATQPAKKAEEYFLSSIANKKDLLNVSTEKFKDILLSSNQKYQPTLYDFLVWRAIKIYYSNYRTELTDFDDDFNPNWQELYSDAETFANFKIPKPESECHKYKILSLLQELTSAHLNDKNQNELIDITLQRLNYADSYYTGKDKDSLHFAQLQKMSEKYTKAEDKLWIDYELANCYVAYANKYDSKNPLTYCYKDYYVKAVEICNKYDKIEKFKRLKYTITKQNLNFVCANEEPSNTPFLLKTEYKNVSEIFVRVAKLTEQEFEKFEYNTYFNVARNKYKNYVQTFSHKLINENDYREKNSEIKVDGLEKGYYIVFASDNSEFIKEDGLNGNYKIIQITDLAVINKTNNKEKVELIVVDRKTGKPIENASVKLYREYWKNNSYLYEQIAQTETDANGNAIFTKTNNDQRNYNVEIEKNNDKLKYKTNTYLPNLYENDNYQVKIFTDRAIYRPGQEVYFKILNYNVIDNKTAQVVENKNLYAVLKDVNWQVIDSVEVTTNNYGTAAGKFKIPQDRLNGRMTIEVYEDKRQLKIRDYYRNRFSKYIRVEEYKRPTFEVELNSPETETALNEEITLSGNAKNYSGINVTNAKVKYKITRLPKWSGWRFCYWNLSQTVIDEGETTTDENGNFNIKFTATPDPSIPMDENLLFTYNVTADVTDINNETQSATNSVSVSLKTLYLSTNNSEELILKNHNKLDKFAINCTNVNGKPIDCDVDVKIYALKSFDKPRMHKKWTSCDNPVISRNDYDKDFATKEYSPDDGNLYNLDKQQLVKQITLKTGTKKIADLSFLNNQKPGNYLVELSAADKNGKKTTFEYRFTLIGKTEATDNVNRYFWTFPVKTNCKPGDTAEIVYGSALENVTMILEVYKGFELLESKIVEINKNNFVYKCEISPEHYGGLTVNTFIVKDGEYFSTNNIISVPYDYKELNINFLTFRDKLQPGENEKWKIKITDYKDKPVDAEFLATLYDESLDVFAANNYYLSIYRDNPSFNCFSSLGFDSGYSRHFTNDKQFNDTLHKLYPEINWFNHSYKSLRSRRMRNQIYMLESTSATGRGLKMAKMATNSAANMDMAFSAADGGVAEDIVEEEIAVEDFDTKDIKIRENFAETAFFSPQITTDKNGELYVEFTIPESLTRWKMLGFAHTQDMKFQAVTNRLTTCKKFSISANLPRFFREGDKISIPVKIANLTDEAINDGKIKLEILDVETLEPIENFYSGKNIKPFSLNANENKAIDFDLEIPFYTKPVICRISAICGNISDGEQKIVPVLINRILITESMSLNIRGNQKKDFEFTDWKNNNSKTAENKSLTFEFTANPVWNAVMALPMMEEYPYDCMEQTFTKLYANAIAENIANSDPNIKKVFDTWKNQQPEALTSNLNKNEELKSTILQETPWAIDANAESARRNRIGKLFDTQLINNQREMFINKLSDGLTNKGGWPWFKGMHESLFVTQYIIAGFGKLQKMQILNTTENPKINAMINNAIDFIDRETAERYNKLKRESKKENLENYHPEYYDIQYLYARSFFKDKAIPKQTKEAFDFYLKQLKKYSINIENLQLQALVATTLNRYSKGDKDAINIVNSLKERAIQSEEFGMYFKANIAGWFWYNAPIETQAMIIEAFDEISNDKKTVEELKIWLIKNKQTNDWKTTKATVEACYALLSTGKKLLTTNAAQKVKIVVGDQKIDMSDAQAGTGYVKKTWEKDQMDKKMADISVTNNNDNIAYGAVYRQYFETLDNVKNATSGIEINKQLFLKSFDKKNHNTLEKITEKTKINAGDKITVRFEIKVDRNMEYVHIKDLRPAGFEPVNVISSYRYQDGLWYYQTTKDASENFFVEYIEKGTYVFEYDIIAVHSGDFSSGIATMQCMYAPEFNGHSNGLRVKVN